MSSTTLELNCFEAFENEINLTLCNDIIRFVIQVSDMKEDEKKAIRTDFENRIIWYDNRNNNDFQEKYQFRYLGEMLERYEENFGSDICDLRAIALALAYTQPLISANMFIGTQQKDFIEKVRLTAGNDIYLEGALHLIDMAQKEQSAWLAEREEKSFDKTEELMFFISLYFQPETIYEKMKTEAIRLLGNEKTISVYSNIGIYCWLIRRFYSCVKADRKKNTVLFKAFVSLPGSWAKEESMPYKILTLHGYSTTEIAFLNYSVLLYSFVPNSIKSTSIVAEKIAVAFCKAVLADPQSQPEEGCELLRYALIKYNEFPIKCFGQKGIWDTIRDCHCNNPNTLIQIANLINYSCSLISFDILNEKWEVLATELNKEKYLRMFHWQLMEDYTKKKLSTEGVQIRLNVFERVTELSYIKTFDREYNSWPQNFSLLIKSKVVSLNELYEDCKKGIYSKKMYDVIWDFVSGIDNREAFEFLRYLFSHYKQHEIAGVLNNLYTEKFYYGLFEHSSWNQYADSRKITLKRDFLLREDYSLIISWLDEWFYLYSQRKYVSFIICILKDKHISGLFTYEELRELYDIVCERKADDIRTGEVMELKERYLTDDELQAEVEAKKEEKRKQELEKEEEKNKKIKDKYMDIDKSSYKEIVKFLNEYSGYYCEDERKIACSLVADSFDEKYMEFGTELTRNEAAYLFKICFFLIKAGAMTLQQIKTYVGEIEEKEVAAA